MINGYTLAVFTFIVWFIVVGTQIVIKDKRNNRDNFTPQI